MTNESSGPLDVAGIANFPFASFLELREAVSAKDFGIGVDPLAAAEWSDKFNSPVKRLAVSALSLLLVLLGLSSVAISIYLRNYWMLAAIPVMAGAFYVSSPASPISKWVTAGGAVSILAFANLLANGLVTMAFLVAYAGLTFVVVRIAGYISNSSFRKALLQDERAFVAAYRNRHCDVRNNKTERVYRARKPGGPGGSVS